MTPRRFITLEQLTPASFAPFGTVIQNPATVPASSVSNIKKTVANQGSATKYTEICAVENHYHLASSRKSGNVAMSMFVCSPRELRKASSEEGSGSGLLGVFDVNILERHPYTTQTFIPMGLSAQDPSTSYLVIVAPTTHTSPARNEILERPLPYPIPDPEDKQSKKTKTVDVYSRARSKPYDNDKKPPAPPKAVTPAAPWSSSHSIKKVTGNATTKDLRRKLPKGTGPPNLIGVRAFIARGNQAVTYGAGTWHAPMVVLGEEAIDFVVLQYVNGVGLEDCQEVEFDSKSDGQKQELISVAIDEEGVKGGAGLAQLRSRI
jgi:ureidoglycolate lyase